MSVETDDHGRLYLSAELRDRYGERFHVVEYEDRIELVPIADDPLEAVREAAAPLKDSSTEELLSDAREHARDQAAGDGEPEGRERQG